MGNCASNGSNHSNASLDTSSILLTMGIGGMAAVIVCLAALVMVLCFKLYRYFVYRLATYQVLAALLYSVVCVIELVVGHFKPAGYPWSCIVAGFLLQYTLWLKLMFTFCLTFHLFCFAVLHKKYDKLEVVYVVLSVVVPLLFNWIPFIDSTYGQAGAWCWIKNWNDTDDNIADHTCIRRGEIEQYALLYGPALIGLSIATVAVTVVAAVLIYRACRTRDVGEQEPLISRQLQQQRKVLKEFLPLIVYPVLSVLFYIPAFINRVIGSSHKSLNVNVDYISFMFSAVSLTSLGILAGLSLIVHILILNPPKKLHCVHRKQENRATATDNKNSHDQFTKDTISTKTEWNPHDDEAISSECKQTETLHDNKPFHN